MQTETQEEQLVFSFLKDANKEKQQQETENKKYIEAEQFNFEFYNLLAEIDWQIEGVDY